jgi:hypothetical protein
VSAPSWDCGSGREYQDDRYNDQTCRRPHAMEAGLSSPITAPEFGAELLWLSCLYAPLLARRASVIAAAWSSSVKVKK